MHLVKLQVIILIKLKIYKIIIAVIEGDNSYSVGDI